MELVACLGLIVIIWSRATQQEYEEWKMLFPRWKLSHYRYSS